MIRILLMAFAVAGFTRCACAAEQPAQPKEMTAVFYDAKGEAAGKTILKEGPAGVLVQLNLENIPPGEHAIHFHEKADCSPASFENAGEHLNPHKAAHGVMAPEGQHAGDMPNIFIGPDGALRTDIINPMVTISSGKPNRAELLDVDGSALIIHASPDDYVTQPSGNAGARVACAEIGGE